MGPRPTAVAAVASYIPAGKALLIHSDDRIAEFSGPSFLELAHKNRQPTSIVRQDRSSLTLGLYLE